MKTESSNNKADEGVVRTVHAPFSVIQHAVAEQFEKMKRHTLYRVDLSGPQGELLGPEQRAAETGRALWDAYLAAFPPGTNPVYKTRTDHDCACCRHFVRTMGGVVAIVDGEVVSIWDFGREGRCGFYDQVAWEMRGLIDVAAIDNLFLHTEKSVGTAKNFQQVTQLYPGVETTDGYLGKKDTVETLTWEHFHLRLPESAVAKKDAIGPRLSDARAAHDVLKRGLEELTLDAVDTVLELIGQNSLYRGAEFRGVLAEFRRLKRAWIELADPVGSDKVCDVFVWGNIGSFAARIRNTAIGTLLIDLSGAPGRTYEAGECASTICPQRGFRHAHDGKEPLELEDAVRKFEASVMAPANYKRPTALVSKAQVEKARAKIEELGLTSALERRYAVLTDVPVNNVLFVDRARKALYGEDVFDGLAAEKPRAYDKVEEVPVEKFLADVLPGAKGLEVLLENRHAANLVSLVAPVDPGAAALFKWPNRLSWSYAGDVADSQIKERVKRAGGSVTGDLCCRLAWDYQDDLDFHMQEPGMPRALGGALSAQGNHIYYANVRRLSRNGGMLDLDANGCDGMKDEPVENIFYADRRKMAEGAYELWVHNYCRRGTGKGFEVEVEIGGETHSFAYEKALRTGEQVDVATVRLEKGEFTVEPKLPSAQAVRMLWGLRTQQFHKVNLVTPSPNHWLTDADRVRAERQGGVGNKHWFFMLEGCRNDGGARGFYNEFLASALEPHRKVMEMVGARMRTDESERQLSGLGFSSTRRDSLTVRITGAVRRVLKVVF